MPGSPAPPGTGLAVRRHGGPPPLLAVVELPVRLGMQPSEDVFDVQNDVKPPLPVPSICHRKSLGSLIEPIGLPVSKACAKAPNEIDCNPFHGSPVGGF